jgi:hypothetical protein
MLAGSPLGPRSRIAEAEIRSEDTADADTADADTADADTADADEAGMRSGALATMSFIGERSAGPTSMIDIKPAQNIALTSAQRL